MQALPYVRILGSADWVATAGNDGASYSLEDKILIDTGWSAVINLINQGIDPLNLSTVLFTHMHADHCMALPQLIMYWYIKRQSLAGLTIAGPRQTMRAAFQKAIAFLFQYEKTDIAQRMLSGEDTPVFVELDHDSEWSCGEYHITVCDSSHAAIGVCYRIAHTPTGHVIGFTGDTMYRPEFATFFKDCDLLVHEASFGAEPLPPRNEVCKHSNAATAAQVAKEAGVKSLLLTHAPATMRDAAVAMAEAVLDIPVGWAVPGRIYIF